MRFIALHIPLILGVKVLHYIIPHHLFLQRRNDLSPSVDFWTGEEELVWNSEHIGDIYDVFPVITFYFPLHGNSSLQFGVNMPPQVRPSLTIVTLIIITYSHNVTKS